MLHLLKPRGTLLLLLTVIVREQDEDAPRRSAEVQATSGFCCCRCSASQPTTAGGGTGAAASPAISRPSSCRWLLALVLIQGDDKQSNTSRDGHRSTLDSPLAYLRIRAVGTRARLVRGQRRAGAAHTSSIAPMQPRPPLYLGQYDAPRYVNTKRLAGAYFFNVNVREPLSLLTLGVPFS